MKILGDLPPVGGMFLVVWSGNGARTNAALHERVGEDLSRCRVNAQGNIYSLAVLETHISDLDAGRHGRHIIPLPPEEWERRRMLIHHGLGKRAIAIPSNLSGDLT